jgi:N-acetylmuramoyl-L-alanine amidase
MMAQINKRYNPTKSLGVKQAPFYVLIGAEMPAILIETGFITNSKERQRLLNSQYRERLADGVVSGIETYIKSIEQVYSGG